MHLLTNRHEDRLIFEIQEPLAKALGIVGTVGRRPSEVMMQHFYVNAKTIGQLNSKSSHSRRVIKPFSKTSCQVLPRRAALSTQIKIFRSRRPPGASLMFGSRA